MEEKLSNPAEVSINIMRVNKLTLGTVESATGGLIAHLITNVPGAPDVFHGAVTTNNNQVKMKIVGVKETTLQQHGAVSAEVAEEMAEGGRKALGVDICIADTGIAGPSGATPGKPVGLFYLALAHKDGTNVRKLLFKGTRVENKQQVAETALTWLRDYLFNL